MATDPVEIDVLVVCQHDAEMVKRCLASCKEGAKHKVNLWVWVNSNGHEEPDVCRVAQQETCDSHIAGYNHGFIKPNNELAKMGSAPYLCLLNADTISAPGWDVPLIEVLTRRGTLVNSIVGYGGALLGRDMVGVLQGQGSAIDYIEGWCLMTTRAVWEQLGGFDEEHLTLAYGEDSDLSLRAKEAGYGVCAVPNVTSEHVGGLGMRSPETDGHQVLHLGGKGATEGTRRSPELQQAFAANHAYLQRRHKRYLESERVLVKGYKRPEGILEAENYSETCVFTKDVWVSDFLHAYEIDGRLWQLDLAGMQPVRFLVP